MDTRDLTVYVHNFDPDQTTHDLLFELFMQAGPVNKVVLKEDYAFVEFEHEESVVYACNLLNDILFFDKPLKLKPRKGSKWEDYEPVIFPTQIEYLDRRHQNEYCQEYQPVQPNFRGNYRGGGNIPRYNNNNQPRYSNPNYHPSNYGQPQNYNQSDFHVTVHNNYYPNNQYNQQHYSNQQYNNQQHYGNSNNRHLSSRENWNDYRYDNNYNRGNRY